MKFRMLIDGGMGGEETIEAANMKEAIEEAIDWAKEGDWPDEGCTVDVTVKRLDDDGEPVEEETVEVEIPPNEPAMIRAAGGDPDCEHEWIADVDIEGGIEENPGVFGIDGGRYVILAHCRKCGVKRREVTAPPSGPGRREISYEPPPTEVQYRGQTYRLTKVSSYDDHYGQWMCVPENGEEVYADEWQEALEKAWNQPVGS